MALRIFDMFCKAGGAGKGYERAGFDVVGMDIEPQPNSPHETLVGDCLAVDPAWIAANFDAVHASPPCQAYSNAQRIQRRGHPDLIAGTRAILLASGLPYTIENVEGAPLIDPVLLCGSMFTGLRVYRHRLFEVSYPVSRPAHHAHVVKQTKMGRPPKDGEFMHVVGNFSGVAAARAAMGIDWMNRDELREAIPPAYTEFLGRQLLAHIEAQRVAA